MRSRERWTAVLVVLPILALVSCPTAIDQDLLRQVEDTIVPSISIDTPWPNSLYGATVEVEGYLSDSSFAAGDNEGLLKSLDFTVLGEALLSRSVSFAKDGSYTVTPDDPSFDFDSSTGYFNFNFSTVELSGGTKVLVFLVTDFNGNRTEKSLTLLEDPSGPYVELEEPVHGTVYGVTVNIEGYVANSTTDPGTNDVKVLRWEVPTAGQSGELNREPEPDTNTSHFTFDPVTGKFTDWFDTVGISGDIFLVFEAFDYRNHKTQITLQLSGNRPGPQITVVSPPPAWYSSAVSREITISGRVQNQDINWTKFVYIASGSISGLKVGSPTVPNHNYPFLPEDDFTLTLNPYSEGIAGLMTIEISATDTSGDRTTSVEYMVQDDPVAPRMQSASLSADSSRIDLAFSEAVYTNNNATGTLAQGDFDLSYLDNGGAALQGWSVTGVDSTHVRINLSLGETPSGAETVAVTAASNQIFDWQGNPMSGSESSGILELSDLRAPTISSASLSGDNSRLDVAFSEDVYTDSDGTGWLQKSDFTLSYLPNGGAALDSWSLSNTNHSEIQVQLDYDGTPTGVETVELKPASGSSIFDEAGNAMDGDESTGEIALH